MDRLSPKQRSFNMSQIKSKNTKPELIVAQQLDDHKLQYQRQWAVPGKPDFAFPELKVAIFVNGEFWHGRRISNIKNKLSEFWIEKITKNIKRDRKNYKLLKKEGWKVVKIWDKDLLKHKRREINKILRSVNESIRESDLKI
ncbi:MAG: very short patch repair endonuclease [Microgenomates group bacterium]